VGEQILSVVGKRERHNITIDNIRVSDNGIIKYLIKIVDDDPLLDDVYLTP